MYTTYCPQALARNCKALLSLMLLPVALASGCQNMNNTEAGALGGGLIGGALGTVVGVAAHNPAAGALIGAGAGAAIGGVSGAAEDRREQRQTQVVTAAVQRGEAELTEVAKMAQGGVGDYIIIDHIRQSGAVFTLSADRIVWLKENKVSDAVIAAMENNGRPQAVYVRDPYVYGPPPPAVVVGVSGGYGYYGRRW